MSKLDEVKKKIDDKMAEKPDSKSELKEPEEEEKDKPTVWTPFAKKIYTDIKLYKAKLGDAQPTRAVATKFRSDIEDKLEKGKEKDSVIKFFNKEFKLPGVSTLPYNYFAETVIDTNAKEKSEQALLKGIVDILDDAINTEREPGPENILKVLAKNILDYIKNFDKPKESSVNERKK